MQAMDYHLKGTGHATETHAISMQVGVRWITTCLNHVVYTPIASIACISPILKTIGLFVFCRMVIWKRSPALVTHGFPAVTVLTRRRRRSLLELVLLEIRRATSISPIFMGTVYAPCMRMEQFGRWPASTLVCLASPSTDAPYGMVT